MSSSSTPKRRPFNFSAGPAALPTEVMLKAQAEFTDFQGSGMGFMELSHRDANGPVQQSIVRSNELLRKLLQVPKNYQVLFFQGGAHGQFAAVPLNLIGRPSSKPAVANYVHSGFWSSRAMDEAAKYCTVNIASDCKDSGFKYIDPVQKWKLAENACYTHICSNETIHGLEFLQDPEVPDAGGPLVADMTSTLLSRPVDVSKYGVIYASGGKNLGPAGLCVVIVRDDLLSIPSRVETPSVLSWPKMASSTPIPSIYNTPPTFLVRMTELVLENLCEKGGVEYAEKRAIRHSSRLYDIIDGSGRFYVNDVRSEYRSRMNVPFRIRGGDTALETKFTQKAADLGMFQVFGHPLFGGQRITLYNGIPDAAVDAVAKFMTTFQSEHK